MDRFIANLLKQFEDGKLTRRELIQTIALSAAACGAGVEAAAKESTTLGFHTIAVNHVSYDVAGPGADYSKARDFYVKLFGMDYPEEHDSGGQAYMPFGPREAGTFMLPRGGRDPNAAPAPPRGEAAGGAGGGGGGRGRGAGGGGTARGGDARGGDAAGGRGQGGGAQQQRRAAIDQIGIRVANYDKKKAETALKKFGLDPKPGEGDSFHVVDPFGMDVQIGGNK